MESLSWFAPILPGKLDEWKSLIEEIQGPRQEEFRRSRERMGVTREVLSHAQTPQGDFIAVFHEADDLARAFQSVATSDHPFDEWFRAKIMEIHGISAEMLQGPPPATVIFDYKAG